MSVKQKYKFSKIGERAFKNLKSTILNSENQIEKDVIRSLEGAMNIFHSVETDYNAEIEGYRSYPLLTPEESVTAKDLIESIGGEFNGVWNN